MRTSPKWQRFLIWLAIVGGLVVALPNIAPNAFLQYLPRFYADLRLPIGIDLQGGARLVVALPHEALMQRGEVMAVLRQRLEMAGEDFADYMLTPQGKQQIHLEVPGLFDVSLLKALVTMPARLAVYAPDGGDTAGDVFSDGVPHASERRVFYSYEHDPPLEYIVHASPLIAREARKQAVLSSDGLTSTALLEITADHAVSFDEDKKVIVVMDGEVLAVGEQSATGRVSLANLEPDFARNLATLINAGPLPLDVSLIEERTIGAELGRDYAYAGLKAALGALVMVALFMGIIYGFCGLLANVALGVCLLLLLATLTVSATPLSLAGFAGLILTIGICVDGIILNLERIREACHTGSTLAQSVETGFSQARATILDANITLLIAAFMLFFLGEGPIRSFAMVMSIGIPLALFTTLIFMPWLLDWWLRHFSPAKIAGLAGNIIPANSSITFMRWRKAIASLTVALVALTIGLYTIAGINYGIDFSGGSLAVLEARQGVADKNDIALRAGYLNIGRVSVERAKDGKRLFLTIESQHMGEAADQSVALKLRGEFDEDYRLERMDVVGPTISAHLRMAGLVAIFLSLVAIFAYVCWRFDWKFALGAVITTLCDAVVLILLFILFQWAFDLWSIAALLAIIGYSLNDTIVVYDRIRSLLGNGVRASGKKLNMVALIDMAINRTLSRTCLTSLATLLAHIPLYYYGNTDMRNFATVLLIGIVIGTFSSIFIAGSLMLLLKSKFQAG